MSKQIDQSLRLIRGTLNVYDLCGLYPVPKEVTIFYHRVDKIGDEIFFTYSVVLCRQTDFLSIIH